MASAMLPSSPTLLTPPFSFLGQYLVLYTQIHWEDHHLCRVFGLLIVLYKDGGGMAVPRA